MTKLDTSKTDWDLSPLLAGDNDPKIKEYREAVAKVADEFANKWRDRDDYLKEPRVLKEALDEYEALHRMPGQGNEGFYFGLKSESDSENPNVKAGENKSTEFYQLIMDKLRFFEMKVAKIDASLQPTILSSEELSDYKHWLERGFTQAAHQLSEGEERIMSLKATPAHQLWAKMTSEFFSKSERTVTKEDGSKGSVTFEELSSLLSSHNKQIRDEAAQAYNDIIRDNLDIATTEFNAVLLDKKINDDLRSFDRPDSARLLGDDMDSDVVDALIAAAMKRADIAQRYYSLKAHLLGQEKLAYHERNIEIGEAKKKYTFAQASELVYDVFSQADPEFGELFASYLQHGQIDVYPRKGKRGGAFCAGNGYLHLPTYILLNHNDELRDVATLAHELGHGINNEMMRQKQNALNCNVPMATAEVASTFFEGLVLDRLLDEADDELELALRMQQLNDRVSTVFRQSMFYAFEQEVHKQFREKGYLSSEELGETFQKYMKAYMGDGVQQDPGSENWWTYIPHFRSFFYVYSYASGELISSAMRKKLREDAIVINDVKQFLQSGFSKSPKDVFADMGIDIADPAFWEEGIDEVESMLTDTEALAKKLGKI